MTYFDESGEIVCHRRLIACDWSVILSGGHGYLALIEDTLVYEFKIGPFEGQGLDKRFI